MKAIARKFTLWLMGLTTLMRYFVIALLFHILVLFVLGSIKIVSRFTVSAVFAPGPIIEEPDKISSQSEIAYTLPSIGGGGGLGGAPPSKNNTSPSEYPTMINPVIGLTYNPGNEPGRLVANTAPGLPGPVGNFGGGGNPNGSSIGSGPGGAGGVFNGRPERRKKSIGNGQASTESERAVLASLRWLKEHQEADGSWVPAVYPAAKTGLATLCYLGHGETPDSEEFGATVSKALTYLTSLVGEDGVVKSHNMYEQGIVTLALAEAYGMTQSPLVHDPLERAVNAILRSQQVTKTAAIHVGGWRYTPNSADSDTSVAGWNIMGLKSARLAGIKIPDEALASAAKFMWNMYGEGGFGYSGPGAGNATTAVGILCEQFLGHGDDKRLAKALDYYAKQNVNWQTPANSLYGWYYATQAMFQAGGDHWDHWNHEFRDTLVKNQATDGHWDEPGPAGSQKANEPVYSTSLCCLMLEVYYRYLPVRHELDQRLAPGSGERASAN